MKMYVAKISGEVWLFRTYLDRIKFTLDGFAELSCGAVFLGHQPRIGIKLKPGECKEVEVSFVEITDDPA